MRKLVFSIIAVLFGTFAMAQQVEKFPKHKECPHKNTEKYWEKMKDKLKLSDEQVADLQTMREKTRVELNKVMKKMKEDRAKEKQRAEEEIKKILTPEQYQEFQKIIRKKMQS